MNETKRQHLWILIKFFAFNVALVFSNIVTDIITAYEFFNRGFTWWGTFTTALIFAPFAAKLVLTVFYLREYFYIILPDKSKAWYQRIKYDKNDARKFQKAKNLVKKLIWKFPLVHPIR